LQPAHYRLEVQEPGFRQFQQENITLDVATTLTINVALEVGQVAQSVVVNGQPPALELQTSSLGQVISNKSIVSLPLNGRNSYGFVALVPGIVAPLNFSQTAEDEYTDQFVSINGAGPSQSLFLLDGGLNSEPGFNGPGFFPSVDLVQEYKVQTSNFSAQYSNTGGGIINVITKSGTNEFHGSAWEFFRNTGLEANDFFSNRAGLSRAPFSFNQFGTTFGGPVKKNRTFFFFAYEGIKWNQSGSAVGTLPTAAQRAGDFSSTYSAQGGLTPIYNPFSTIPNPAHPGQYVRTPFPGNKIPASDIDPVANNLLNYLPLPNQPGQGPAGTNNYVVNFSTPITENQFSLRIDQAITDNQKLFGRYSINDTTQTSANLYGNSPNYLISSPTPGTNFLRQQQVTLDYVNALSVHKILDLNSSFIRYHITRRIPGFDVNPTVVGLPSYFNQLAATYPPCFPYVNVTGMGLTLSISNAGGGFIGTACTNIDNPFQSFFEYGSFTVIRNVHTFTMGGNFGAGLIGATNFTAAGPSFSYSPSFTQGPNPTVAGTGYGFASFLLGTGTGSTGSGGPDEIVSNHYYGGFFQDDWRVTPRLTLNLGIRYDYMAPRTERHNRITSWSATDPSPLQVPGLNLTGGLVFPGVSGLSRYEYNPTYTDVSPRLGFAYAASPNTAIRGGYGLFVAPSSGTAFNGNSVPITGFQATTPWTSSLNGVTPLYTMSDPFPQGFVSPTGSSLGLATQLGQSVVAMDRHRPNAYSEQWNVDVQQQFPGEVLFDLAYAGSHGVHLYADSNPNQLPDEYLAQGNQLNALVPNPFYGKIASGSLSAPTVAASRLLVPFPQFTGVTLGNGSSYGASNYNSLQAKVEKRLSHGFDLLAAYTWSKLMNNMVASDSNFPGTTIAVGSIQDWDNLRAEYALATFDTPQSVAVSGIYELPVGRGKRFLSQNRVADRVLGGWQLNGIFKFSSGNPLQVTTASNTLFNYGGTQRANWNGQNPSLSGSIANRLNRYFNTSDFSAPAPFTYGNSSRTIAQLRDPGYINTDLSGIKNIPIHEQLSVEFRAEAFNLFNHPQFSAPDTGLGDATFGQISSLTNIPRQIQLAVKIVW
jgi:hypothetical protein